MFFDDGDELHIVMTESDDGYKLTDEGHTMMWLPYKELRFTGNQKKLLNWILGQKDVAMVNGKIMTSVDSPEEVGPTLFNMIQAIMQTSNLKYLSRNNVVNTFLEDVRMIFRNSEMRDRCRFGKGIETHDGNLIEPDVYIDLPTTALVFGAQTPNVPKRCSSTCSS